MKPTLHKKRHNVFFVYIVIILIAIGILSLCLLRNATSLRDLENTHHTLYVLGSELKESSEELTKFCRNYVITGDASWEQKYWDILNVRNGKKARSNGRLIALRDSLSKLGITKNEYQKLVEAEDNSNALVWTEKTAFNAMKGIYLDSLSKFTVKGSPNPILAKNILYNEKYHQDKANIMRPIASFRSMINNRFLTKIEDLKDINVHLVFAIIALIISSSVLSFYAILVMRKKIINQLVELRVSNIKTEQTLQNLKNTQTKLIQVEKMAALGTLTAGMGHEINNPLNYIMGAYEVLNIYFEEHGSKDQEMTSMSLTNIKEGINKVSNIVHGLNQFSRDNSNFDEDCDIHDTIDNCLLMLQHQMNDAVIINKLYYKTPIKVKGNVGKLHQVFLNILSNALYAIGDKGQITITTQKDNEQSIRIEISDNGIGIKKSHLHQIKDPFFTTKPPGEGTGLGMAISDTIVKKHKGQLTIESEEGKGSKISVILPLKKLNYDQKN
ncbi:sensor histidine kinase [Aestuariivivens insulae]|uniref:sensor histidine kinase n=1 Tax=Aestuariivivens insulae TaxID=1621988 RepID=UPI001F55D656|nr:HAMP domain-containing sensor histidine kinase [Aestuariivivens insulae]